MQRVDKLSRLLETQIEQLQHENVSDQNRLTAQGMQLLSSDACSEARVKFFVL